MMSQRRQIALSHQRLVSLAAELRTGGKTIRELAEHHGVTLLTIRRELQLLASLGLPVVDERHIGRQRLWRIVTPANEMATR